MRAILFIGSKRLRMALSHQASRNPPAQSTDLYFQSWAKASLSGVNYSFRSVLLIVARHLFQLPTAAG